MRGAGPGWATLVVRNGRVLTMDPARPQASAVAAHGARILAVGTDDEMDDLVRPGVTQVHDAGGRTVAPGFVDIHAHLEWGGLHRARSVRAPGRDDGGHRQLRHVGRGRGRLSRGGRRRGRAVQHRLLRRPAGAARTGRPEPTCTRPCRPPSCGRLEELADRALAAGAVGVSLGPEYVPGADWDELLTLARAAAAHGTLSRPTCATLSPARPRPWRS